MENNSSGGSTIFIIAIIVLTIVAVIAALIYSRKRGKKSVEIAQQLGFTPLNPVEAEVMRRLQDLYQTTRPVLVTYASKKVDGGEQIYLFDITISSPSSRQNSGTSKSRCIAILSPHLRLPSFLLISRMPALGPFGDMLDDLITSGASSQGFQEWDHVPPDFSLRYMLYTQEGADIESVFTEPVLARIAQTEQIIARGKGDLLLFNTYAARSGVDLDASKLANHVQMARQLCGWLSM